MSNTTIQHKPEHARLYPYNRASSNRELADEINESIEKMRQSMTQTALLENEGMKLFNNGVSTDMLFCKHGLTCKGFYTNGAVCLPYPNGNMECYEG